jgi:hypothetical protein
VAFLHVKCHAPELHFKGTFVKKLFLIIIVFEMHEGRVGTDLPFGYYVVFGQN